MANNFSALAAINKVAHDLGVNLAFGTEVGKNISYHPVHGVIAGSAAMIAWHQLQLGYFGTDYPPANPWFYEYGDVDCFMLNPGGDASHMVRADERLLGKGYLYDGDRQEVTMRRIDVNGQPRWITNSVKLVSPEGIKVNLINKTVNGNRMLDAYDVLKTFDWSWLTVAAWDLHTGGMVHLETSMQEFYASQGREFLLLTNRLDDFLDGIMSEHVMMRQMPRLAKYVVRLVAAHEWAVAYGKQNEANTFANLLVQAGKISSFMVKAYQQYANFMWDRTDTKSRTLGDVAGAFAGAAEKGNWQLILDVALKYGSRDSLDRLVDELI